jgi:hypothetical protein
MRPLQVNALLAQVIPRTNERSDMCRERKYPDVPHSHEKLTNLGSLGIPSAPILFFLKRSCMKIRLASSKSTPRRFMMRITSFLPASSSPCRESPASTFPERSNADDERPASMSSRKEVGRRV